MDACESDYPLQVAEKTVVPAIIRRFHTAITPIVLSDNDLRINRLLRRKAEIGV